MDMIGGCAFNSSFQESALSPSQAMQSRSGSSCTWNGLIQEREVVATYRMCSAIRFKLKRFMVTADMPDLPCMARKSSMFLRMRAPCGYLESCVNI